MLKRIPLLALVMLLWTLPVHAQGSSWQAWLYDPSAGQVTLVSEAGESDAFQLPLPPNFDRYPQRIAIGHGGEPFAYIVFNSTTFQGQLVVSRGAEITATFSLPLTFSDSLELGAGEQVFNEDNSALALGYSLDGGGWAIIVFDINAGAVISTLRHDTPTVAILGLPGGFGLTPVIRRFQNQAITFSLVQSGSEGAAQYDSYTWTLASSSLVKNTGFISLDSDQLAATGEVVMPLPDERLPNQNENFTFFQSNSLHVFDPISGARFPFYNTPGETLFWPHFIQGGQSLLVGSSVPDGATVWRVIGRDGQVIGSLPVATVITSLAGVNSGFIYTTDAFTPGATTLVYVNTTDGLDAGVPVWTSAPGATPVIAWAGDDLIIAQSAFTVWAKLADPVYTPGSVPIVPQVVATTTPAGLTPGQVPQVTPLISGLLAVGRLAVIHTTDGDQLNLRFGPGTDFEIVAQLSDGARVTLLEGPRNTGSLSWWKVRTASGIEGWVVESVNDNGTRLQTLLPQ